MFSGSTSPTAAAATTTTAATVSLERGRERGGDGQRAAAQLGPGRRVRQREVVVGLLPRVLLLPALRPAPLRAWHHGMPTRGNMACQRVASWHANKRHHGMPMHGNMAWSHGRLMMVLISKSVYKFLTRVVARFFLVVISGAIPG